MIDYTYEIDDVKRQQIIKDITCSAFEGGSTFWAKDAKRETDAVGAEFLSDVPALGGVVSIIEYDDDGDVGTHQLNSSNIWDGIQKRAAQLGLTIQRWYEEHDACEADCAIQFGIFNQVKYG